MDYEFEISTEGADKGFQLTTRGTESDFYTNVVDASRGLGRQRLWANLKFWGGILMMGTGGSLDLGISWRILESKIQSANYDYEGALIAVALITGWVTSAWYVTKDGGRENAILDAKDKILKQVFSKPSDKVTIIPLSEENSGIEPALN